MSTKDEDEIHELIKPFLLERLEQLGLDYDVYGAYVTPLLSTQDADQDEWDSVLELLQASSETHSDDENAWKKFRDDLQSEWRERLAVVQAREREQHDRAQQEFQERMEKEKQVAREAEILKEEGEKKYVTTADDAAKKALVARFGFEGDDDEGGEEEGPVLTNKQVAEQAAREHAQEMRNQSKTTKREEQQKTARSKIEKAQLKEERRKKATKGERKR